MATWIDMVIKGALVILIVIIVIIFTNSAAFGMVKNFLKQTDKEEEINKDQALVNFQKVTELYDNCFSSKQSKCICFQSVFPRFPSTYTLRFFEGSEEEKLRTITLFDQEQELTRATLQGDFGCWMTYTKDNLGNYQYRLEPAFSLHFDKPKKYLIGTKDKIGDLPDNFPFLYKTPDGNICFVLEDTVVNKKWYEGDFSQSIKDQRSALRDYIQDLPVCS